MPWFQLKMTDLAVASYWNTTKAAEKFESLFECKFW